MELQLIKRRPRVLLASLGMVVALGGLPGCGSQDSVGGAPTHQSGQSLDQTVAKVNEWWGSDSDRQATEVVIAYRLNGAYDTCLNEKGFPRKDWRESILLVGSTTPLDGVTALIEPDIRPFSQDLEINATNAEIETALNNPPSRNETEVRAEDDCIEETRSGQPSDAEVDNLRLPSSVERLREEWSATLSNAYKDLGAAEDFGTCVDKQQVPQMRGKSLDEAATLAAEVKRKFGIGEGKLTQDKTESFRSWEAPIAAAIWKCAQPHHDEAVAKLPDIVSAFEKAHSDEIAKAERLWSERRSEATDLGWSPSEPRAGLSG